MTPTSGGHLHQTWTTSTTGAVFAWLSIAIAPLGAVSVVASVLSWGFFFVPAGLLLLAPILAGLSMHLIPHANPRYDSLAVPAVKVAWCCFGLSLLLLLVLMVAYAMGGGD